MDRMDTALREFFADTAAPRGLARRLVGRLAGGPPTLEALAGRFRIEATDRGVLRLYPRRGVAAASARAQPGDAGAGGVPVHAHRLPARLRARAARRRAEPRGLRLDPRRAERGLPAVPRLPAGRGGLVRRRRRRKVVGCRR